MVNIEDDPFAVSGENTIILPSPGGRSPVQSSLSRNESTPLDNEPIQTLSGLNPLVAAANPLLDSVASLRATLNHPNPSALRDQLAQYIKQFEAQAKSTGIAHEQIIGGSYILCTLLDEIIASTPWGGSGIWANLSLLVMFHNEAWGGEKFFQLLSKLAENPSQNKHLLELIYICLSLGFEGRYRVIENGKAQLDTVRERLALMIQNTSDAKADAKERTLSPHWQGTATQEIALFSLLPLWVIVAASSTILLGIFFALDYHLNRYSDPVFEQIFQLHVSSVKKQPTASIAPSKPRLATFLAPDIQEGSITVRDEADRSIVTIRGDHFFQPGSATISERYLPLLTRVAEALNAVQGTIQVTGHTDNQPIHSLRFPSNWHLSKERAQSVVQKLSEKLPLSRLSAEGKGDAQPITSNDTPANRARNRRVEITLFVTGKVSQ